MWKDVSISRLNDISLYVYAYIFFIQSSLRGHLVCFPPILQAFLNNATMYIGVQMSLADSPLYIICPEVGWLHHRIVLFLNFLRNLPTVFQIAPLTFPPAVHTGLISPHFFLCLIVVVLIGMRWYCGYFFFYRKCTH